MAVDFSQVKPGQQLKVQPINQEIKLFLERQGYYVGQTVQVMEISDSIPSFNPRTGKDDIYLAVTVSHGGRPLKFDVRESDGYTSEYFT